MTTARLSELWASLGESAATDGFRLHLLATKAGIRAFASVDGATGHPGLLLEMPPGVRTFEGRALRTQGFIVEAARFAGLAAGRTALAIHLRDPSFSPLFVHLCANVLDAFRGAQTTQVAAAALVRTIERWRAFVQAGARPLSEEAVRGLLGELTVLARLIGKVGASAALGAWENPGTNLRDFELADFTVEVKTYQADSGRKVRISSPEQLDRDVYRPLILAAVEIARVEATGRTLPEVVMLLEQSLPGALREELRDKLATYGYLPAHAEHYTVRYATGPVLTFAVEEGFPRIRKSAIPPPVQDVSFSLAVVDLEPFSIPPGSVVGEALPELEGTP